MIGDTGSMIGVVPRDRHPVHGHDFERLTLKLQIQITICGSIHQTPELALARGDFDLWPHGTIHCKDLFWLLWLPTTNIRTEFHALLQLGRLRVVRKGASADNQNAFWQPDK